MLSSEGIFESKTLVTVGKLPDVLVYSAKTVLPLATKEYTCELAHARPLRHGRAHEATARLRSAWAQSRSAFSKRAASRGADEFTLTLLGGGFVLACAYGTNMCRAAVVS